MATQNMLDDEALNSFTQMNKSLKTIPQLQSPQHHTYLYIWGGHTDSWIVVRVYDTR